MSQSLVSIACLTGFIGDILLQIGAKYFHLGGSTGWGLKSYFEQHGAAESTFIAGGMMSIFYVIFLQFFPLSYLNLAIYGILVDLFFRKTMFFTSLKGYYEYFNYFWSAVWIVIPMFIPLLIFQLLMSKISFI
jgi:hypothetical protein